MNKELISYDDQVKLIVSYYIEKYKPIKDTDSTDLKINKLLNLMYNMQGMWAFFANKEFWISANRYDSDKTIKLQLSVHPSYRDLQAVFRLMHIKKLIGGCPCGCRGDFEITDKGLEYINKERFKAFSSY